MKYIVTGTSRGLGFQLASSLMCKGEIAGVSRNIGESQILNGSSAFRHLPFDLSNVGSEEFKSLVNDLMCFVGDDEVTLVLNAAEFYMSKQRLCYEELRNLFDINVFSLMCFVEAFQSARLRRVFVINSISGLVGQETQHEYSASKHAVMGYIRSLIKSAKNKNYDVMCINPGGIKTDLWYEHTEVQTREFIDPVELAQVCVELLSIKQRLFIEELVILPPSDL